MRVHWRPAAIADVRDILSYIKNRLKNPSAAKAMGARILDSIALLQENPYMGALLCDKLDLDEGVKYRYLIVSKQIIFYKVTEDVIEIIRVLDACTDYLSALF